MTAQPVQMVRPPLSIYACLWGAVAMLGMRTHRELEVRTRSPQFGSGRIVMQVDGYTRALMVSGSSVDDVVDRLHAMVAVELENVVRAGVGAQLDMVLPVLSEEVKNANPR